MKVLVSFSLIVTALTSSQFALAGQDSLQIGKCEKEITSAAQQWIDAQDNLMNTKSTDCKFDVSGTATRGVVLATCQQTGGVFGSAPNESFFNFTLEPETCKVQKLDPSPRG